MSTIDQSQSIEHLETYCFFTSVTELFNQNTPPFLLLFCKIVHEQGILSQFEFNQRRFLSVGGRLLCNLDVIFLFASGERFSDFLRSTVCSQIRNLETPCSNKLQSINFRRSDSYKTNIQHGQAEAKARRGNHPLQVSSAVAYSISIDQYASCEHDIRWIEIFWIVLVSRTFCTRLYAKISNSFGIGRHFNNSNQQERS